MSVTWSDFEAAAPDLATEGRRLIYARGDGEALLATVRGDDLPRIHPVNVAIVDGRLYVFVIARSPKRGDLELTDATRCTPTRIRPRRASSRSGVAPGWSTTTANGRAVAAGWAFTIDDGYTLFELGIESALLGVRDRRRMAAPLHRLAGR